MAATMTAKMKSCEESDETRKMIDLLIAVV